MIVRPLRTAPTFVDRVLLSTARMDVPRVASTAGARPAFLGWSSSATSPFLSWPRPSSFWTLPRNVATTNTPRPSSPIARTETRSRASRSAFVRSGARVSPARSLPVTSPAVAVTVPTRRPRATASTSAVRRIAQTRQAVAYRSRPRGRLQGAPHLAPQLVLAERLAEDGILRTDASSRERPLLVAGDEHDVDSRA